MSTIIEIPLNSGMDQGTDRVLQGQDKLSYVQNARLARDGRLELRPSFTALSTGTFSSASMTAYDVANYAGRLVALGDQCGQSRPTDLFEWVEARSLWRATSGDETAVAEGVRLPQLTNIRAIGMLPDFPESIHTVGLAAGDGYVCVVAERLGTGRSVVHILRADTNASILIEDVELERPVVCFAGGRFWIAGHDTDEDLITYDFTVASSETLTGPTTRSSNADAVQDVAIKPCGSGFVIGFATSTTCAVFRYDSSGVQQATWTAFASQTDSVALACNAAGSLISVARQNSSSDYELSTFNASGVLQNGPTSLFGGAGGSGTRLGMDLLGTSLCIAGVDELNRDGLYQEVVQSTHSAGSTRTYVDARPEGAPTTCNGKCYIGWVDMTATDRESGTYHVVTTENFIPQAFLGNQLCDTTTTGANEIQGMGVDGTKLYFAVLTIGQNNGAVRTGLRYRFAVYEAETAAVRRQMVQVGGELLISGGLPLTYDGRTMVEQGFAEKPTISFDSEATTPGSLTQLATYQAIAVWETYDAKGRLLRSQPSDPVSHTLTGANDTIYWRVSTPHSLRRHPAFADQAQTIRVSVYRTEADEGVFFIDTQVTVPLTDPVAEFVTVESRFSDSLLIDNAILYTQSQAAIANVSPQPYRYVWPARERAFTGGRPEEESWAMSKLLFPGEPLEFAFDGRLGFSGRVGQPITAVGAFETVGLIWTESEIWMVPGRGPEHNGTGEFDPSTPIATPGGTYDWRSVIVAPPGAFFQMMPNRLMLLERGGAVQWIGSPVQDTLALYPNIAGCVFVRQLDIVAFACNNSLGTDGVFLVYDMTNGQWFVDTIGAAITSVSEVDGRLVYVAGGAVFQQDLTIGLGVGAMPTMIFETPSYRFFSAGGFGDLIKVALIGTYLGDSTVGLEVSYDDGKNYVPAVNFAVTSAAMTNNATGAALASGDSVTLVWTPAQMECDRFRLRFTMSNATATAGCRWHVISLEVNGQLQTTRKPAGNQR